jgi:L-ascorbate metabolism protein UlaG (beta-lactamase superfamily)
MKNLLPKSNKELKTIKENWDGNPLLNNGKQYCNLDGASERSFKEVLKWQTSKKPLKILKKGQKSPLDVVCDKAFLDKKIDGFTWLGHASYVIDIEGKRLVIDPVFFDVSIVKRFTQLPCQANEIVDVDYILLSHNHRDHIDEKSIKLLCKLNPKLEILTSLCTSKQLLKWGIKNQIIEAGWYQEFNLENEFKISYLPAKHWTRRYLTDTNVSLWGSFMIESKSTESCIYFGADSGYGVHFKEIGSLFPNITFAMLGIGAYEPTWFMHTSHTGPGDALKAFKDLNAKTLVPMHYGTFDLSDEPVYYPEQILKELTQNEPNEIVKYLKIGEKNLLK